MKQLFKTLNTMKDFWTIEFQDRKIDVECNMKRGYKSNDYDVPNDPDELYIDRIEYNGREISNLLSDDSHDFIRELIWEKYA